MTIEIEPGADNAVAEKSRHRIQGDWTYEEAVIRIDKWDAGLELENSPFVPNNLS